MPIFRKKRDNEPVDMEARSPLLGVKYRDLAVIDQLMKHGADMSQPRHVIHFLYFPSQAAAAAAGEASRGKGCDVSVKDPIPEFPDQWSVVCETHVVTDPDTVRGTSDFFDQLAATHGGEYDGWEASV